MPTLRWGAFAAHAAAGGESARALVQERVRWMEPWTKMDPWRVEILAGTPGAQACRLERTA